MRYWVNVIFIVAALTYFWFYLISSSWKVKTAPKYLDLFGLEDEKSNVNEVVLDEGSAKFMETSNCLSVETETQIKVDGQTISFSPGYKSPPKSDFLNVFLVLHSHLDPGWLMTFTEYYDQQVSNIFTNMIKYLSEHPDGKFIWSEMSFLYHFWITEGEDKKKKVKEFIQNGQLELCGAAWVMTDEATPYFWATIDNIVEGQRFVYDTFGYTANTSWSVDPFGHGGMNPYLMSLAGINSMVVGRLNQHVKIEMREKAAMIFKWAQPWQQGREQKIPTVMSLPDIYYTTTNGCGINGSVCCQYEWGTSARSYCPEKKEISKKNVEFMSRQLVDQFKTYHRFYNGDSLLVSVGDDFYYRNSDDFDSMYKNYKQIINHINANPEYKTKIQFSTIGQYFEHTKKTFPKPPILRGDFFPYTENMSGGHPYWSGYFVHRGNFKQMERKAQGRLRRLDLIRALFGVQHDYDDLTLHRRNLSLTQHHDSITGTSKPHVMTDYRIRLYKAVTHFAQKEAEYLAGGAVHDVYDDGQILQFNETMKEKTLIIFNQNTESDEKKVAITINTDNVEIRDESGQILQVQALPGVNKAVLEVDKDYFEIVFYLKCRALSHQKVTVTRLEDGQRSPKTHLSEAHEVSGGKTLKIPTDKFTMSITEGEIKVEGSSEKINVGYGYHTDMGGAYVFNPLSVLKTIRQSRCIFFTGPLTSRVYCKLDPAIDKKSPIIVGLIEIDSKQHNDSVQINLEVFSQLKDLNGHTFILKIGSHVQGNTTIWTDVNGLYLNEHKMNRSLPLAANYFPSPSESMVQDKNSRLTVLARQSTGSTVAENGELHLLLDRSVYGEDGKGLGLGEAKTEDPSHFKARIIIERITAPKGDTIFHSKFVDHSLEDLLHPIGIVAKRPDFSPKGLPEIYWPCNIQLINLRQVKDFHLLTIRKLEFDCSIKFTEKCEIEWDKLDVTLKKVVPYDHPKLIFSSLSAVNEDSNEEYSIERLQEKLTPFEIVTIKISQGN